MATNAAAQRLPNRWTIVVAAVVMQLALGSVYAWSVFVPPLRTTYGWTAFQANLPFSVAIAVLGIAAFLGGGRLNAYGPRLIATVGGIFYGVGLILAGLIVKDLTLLSVTYGIVGGIGLGLGYIVPVATLVKWFPDKRGLVTGLAVCGFGGGSVLTILIARQLLANKTPVGTIFIVLGVVYFIMVVASAQFFASPPAGYRPAGWMPSTQQTSQRAERDFAATEALSRVQWYALWAMLALNVTAGIMLISQAAPFVLSLGQNAATAASFVIAVGVFNAAGRFFWAWLSDRIGRRQVFMTMFALQCVMFLILVQNALAATPNFGLAAAVTLVIALCYGGGFGTMPAFTADYFGPKNAGTIYGAMLTAWSVGGVAGPFLIAAVLDNTKHYTLAFVVLAGVMAVSFLLPLFVRPPKAAVEVAASPQAQVSPA